MQPLPALTDCFRGCQRAGFGVYAMENVPALRFVARDGKDMRPLLAMAPARPVNEVAVCEPVRAAAVIGRTGRKKMKPEL
jgi:hypothetical protein